MFPRCFFLLNARIVQAGAPGHLSVYWFGRIGTQWSLARACVFPVFGCPWFSVSFWTRAFISDPRWKSPFCACFLKTIIVLAARQCAAWASTLITHKHCWIANTVNNQGCVVPVFQVLIGSQNRMRCMGVHFSCHFGIYVLAPIEKRLRTCWKPLGMVLGL